MEYLRGKVFKLEKNKENAGMFRRDSESSSDVHNGFWKDFFVSNGINPLDITSHGILTTGVRSKQ